MAKLDTTVNNLELKTNKVIGTEPSDTWTDEQYPSAKTLYSTYTKMLDLMHPIGSTYITETNVNPAELFGGEWTLYDKEFENRWVSLDGVWKPDSASIYSNSAASISGHTVALRIQLKNTTELSDSTFTLGQLDVAALGLTEFPYRIFCDCTAIDYAGTVVLYEIVQDGTIKTHDVLNIQSLAAGNALHTLAVYSDNIIYLNAVYNIHSLYRMKDEFCDKFYWRRTA